MKRSILARALGRSAPPLPAPIERAALADDERIYAIGDIHGCLALLENLHALIAADLATSPVDRPERVYVGDYVDRGRDSRGVIDCLIASSALLPPATFIKGNHEEILEQFLRAPEVGAAWCTLGGRETLLSYDVDPERVGSDGRYDQVRDGLRANLPEDHARFLQTLITSYRKGPYFFCHAGIKPGVALERQQDRDLMWIRGEFLDSRSDHGAIVVHGHTPAREPEVYSNRIGIDTGAYATQRLTCAVLEPAGVRWLSTLT